ncbi:MAG TPA: glycosyltransferase [Chloroflexota bacterium]|nr:glycosyltransferase [Chloroflexota bacterium]
MRQEKTAAPRIAQLVHNQLEHDPRVSRHAAAARRAGYRVAVLSVGSQGAEQARWGEPVAGIPVYESRIVRASLLGRARAFLQRLAGRRSRSGSMQAAHLTGAPAIAAERTGGVRQAVRDLWTVAMLLRNNIGVFRQFRGVGARLVHANDLNVLFCGYLLARAWKARLIYDSHELWTALDTGVSPLHQRLMRLLEGWLIRRADAVITVNSAIAAELARMYGIPTPVVVMNCPEAPSSGACSPLDDSTAAPALCSERVTAIYQGNLSYREPHLETMLAEVALVDAVAFTIRGPGAISASLQERIDEADNVRLLPPVPMAEAIEALQGYDIGVVPYLPVNRHFLLCSPNKLFDYMMAGTAVVCSDLPVLREVVSGAECGLLYDPARPGALAEALRRLCGDRDLLARFKANARRAARERYNATVEVKKLVVLYDRLVRGGSHMGGN